MLLDCDLSIAASYKSPAQRARVISELWFEKNSYCLACDSESLRRSTPNTMATDFSCEICGHRYELKAFLKRPNKSLVDGAYVSLISRIQNGSTPTLCLLERNEAWTIKSLTAIHSSFLTPWVIERRPPLGPNARRAGWIGCNIRLDRIPPDGEIAVIENGIVYPRETLRERFRRFLPLSTLSAHERGWTVLTLRIIRKLSNQRFTLSAIYAYEKEFSAVYPQNRHIRDKIRQQLQVLRDLNVLAFEERGQYRILT